MRVGEEEKLHTSFNNYKFNKNALYLFFIYPQDRGKRLQDRGKLLQDDGDNYKFNKKLLIVFALCYACGIYPGYELVLHQANLASHFLSRPIEKNSN